MLYRVSPYAYPRMRRHCQNTPHARALPVDVAEEEGHYLIHASVPGIPAEDIEITVQDGVLTIKAEREQAAEGSQYRLQERHQGAWIRRFALAPEIDAEGVAARYDQGVLTLEIPKAEKPLPQRIAITASGS